MHQNLTLAVSRLRNAALLPFCANSVHLPYSNGDSLHIYTARHMIKLQMNRLPIFMEKVKAWWTPWRMQFHQKKN